MSNPFFSTETLMNGGQQMLNLIKDCAEQIYSDNNQVILPKVKPGFLRHQLKEEPPEEGNSVDYLMEMTKKVIFPGTMRWQSPKFFGYYPSAINVTNIFGDMFHIINHSPAFSFATSPSWTQLQNIVVDWSVKALGLPEHFLLKNSGGGIINNSSSESIFNSVHIAKHVKRKELGIELNNPAILKFVGYFGSGSYVGCQKALMIKDIYHRRSIPYIYNKDILNYEMDVDKFEQIVKEDVENGLIPFWFGFTYGNTFSTAIDCSQRAFQICKKYKIWINVDASFLGSTWFSQKYRPPQKLLEYVDTMDINFSKLLLNGAGGALSLVKDKKKITEAFGGTSQKFSFFKNEFTGQTDVVDYKDWIIGLSRRNNAIKFYYTYQHYGIKKIRQAIEGQQEKFEYLLQLIEGRPDLFQLHTKQYGVTTFFVLNKNGMVINELNKIVNKKITNIGQGFTSPGEFKGMHAVRMVVGHFHTQKQHIRKYFDAVVAVAEEERERFSSQGCQCKIL